MRARLTLPTPGGALEAPGQLASRPQPLPRMDAAQQSESPHPEKREASRKSQGKSQRARSQRLPPIRPELRVPMSRCGLHAGTRCRVWMVTRESASPPETQPTEPLFLSLPSGSPPWAEQKEDGFGTSAPLLPAPPPPPRGQVGHVASPVTFPSLTGPQLGGECSWNSPAPTTSVPAEDSEARKGQTQSRSQ